MVLRFSMPGRSLVPLMSAAGDRPVYQIITPPHAPWRTFGPLGFDFGNIECPIEIINLPARPLENDDV